MTDERIQIYIYDEIRDEARAHVFGLATPQSVRKQLDRLPGADVDVYINSPGGSPFAASAIGAMLERHAGAIHVHIDGLAASAASMVAMYGDRITMAPESMLMIHRSVATVDGNASELAAIWRSLEATDLKMCALYARRSGLPAETVKEMMDKETWMTAEEALSLGFADEISGTAVKMVALFDDAGGLVNGLRVNALLFNKIKAERNIKKMENELRKTNLNAEAEDTQVLDPVGIEEIVESEMFDIEILSEAVVALAGYVSEIARTVKELSAKIDQLSTNADGQTPNNDVDANSDDRPKASVSERLLAALKEPSVSAELKKMRDSRSPVNAVNTTPATITNEQEIVALIAASANAKRKK